MNMSVAASAIRLALVGALVVVAFALVASPAQASRCPSETVGGKTIGWIEFDNVKVPLKSVTYPAGGALDPPASAEVAGVSARHQPLLARQGSTVIAWHVRYGKGCEGALNPLLKKKMGSTFAIVSNEGERQEYRLVDRAKVKRGRYKPEWFRTNGAPQVSLFTCSDLTNGKYRTTTALFAEPIRG